MDARLARIAGHRPHRLLKKDLPELAKALVTFPFVQVGRDVRGGVEYVQLQGVGVDLIIMSEDWESIFPLVEVGFFCDPVYPSAVLHVLRMDPRDDPSQESSSRNPAYRKALAKLQELFPADYPIPRL
jgi:hypothetical protein